MSSPWRLLVDPPRDGASNMAIDEALLSGQAGAGRPESPTLRLYTWCPSALSLGRRQPAERSCDRAFLEAEGIGLVRRPTGGRAVLHEHELTYAIVASLGVPPFDGGVLDAYRKISRAIAGALCAMGAEATGDPAAGGERDPGPFGPPVCFDRVGAHEITIGGRKVVGSAQLRRRGALLQHGSILLRADPVRVARAIGAPADASRFVDLETALGRPVDPAALGREIVSSFEKAFGVVLVPGRMTAREEALAETLRCERYLSDAWTVEGRLVSPEISTR